MALMLYIQQILYRKPKSRSLGSPSDVHGTKIVEICAQSDDFVRISSERKPFRADHRSKIDPLFKDIWPGRDVELARVVEHNTECLKGIDRLYRTAVLSEDRDLTCV